MLMECSVNRIIYTLSMCMLEWLQTEVPGVWLTIRQKSNVHNLHFFCALVCGAIEKQRYHPRVTKGTKDWLTYVITDVKSQSAACLIRSVAGEP